MQMLSEDRLTGANKIPLAETCIIHRANSRPHAPFNRKRDPHPKMIRKTVFERFSWPKHHDIQHQHSSYWKEVDQLGHFLPPEFQRKERSYQFLNPSDKRK
jgi:hypothetical protein